MIKNRVQLIGQIGNTPSVTIMEDGSLFARFTVGTTEHYNYRGANVKETMWHMVVATGSVAKIVEKFVAKGDEVALEGRLLNRSYADKDGVKKHITEIDATSLILVNTNTNS